MANFSFGPESSIIPDIPSLRWFGVFLLALCSGCASLDKTSLDESDNRVVLLNPGEEPGGEWEHRRLRRGDTAYRRVSSSLGDTIRATGNESASIMFRLFEPVSLDCNRLRWNWRVAKPQAGADLHVKGKDDVAASVFILFGDPGIFRDTPVPTLKYAWTNKRHRVGEVIVGPYHRKTVRTIVVRTGSPVEQELVTDIANLGEDYLRAFGETPADGISGVAIFTDNDDTREPIVAHYGRIELLCDGI